MSSRRFFRTNFENLLRHAKLTIPVSLNCSISTVHLLKLPMLAVYGYNKISKSPCILAPFWSDVTGDDEMKCFFFQKKIVL